LWLHSLKVAQLLRSAACLHTNHSRSYLNHLVLPSRLRRFKNASFPCFFPRSDQRCQNRICREFRRYVRRSAPNFPYTADHVDTFLRIYYPFTVSSLRSNLVAEEICFTTKAVLLNTSIFYYGNNIGFM